MKQTIITIILAVVLAGAAGAATEVSMPDGSIVHIGANDLLTTSFTYSGDSVRFTNYASVRSSFSGLSTEREISRLGACIKNASYTSSRTFDFYVGIVGGESLNFVVQLAPRDESCPTMPLSKPVVASSVNVELTWEVYQIPANRDLAVMASTTGAAHPTFWISSSLTDSGIGWQNMLIYGVTGTGINLTTRAKTTIFSDGFESGDLGAWSAVVNHTSPAPVTADVYFEVGVIGTGSVSAWVGSDPAGIWVPFVGDSGLIAGAVWSFPVGTVITFTVHPEPGTRVQSWHGCIGNGNVGTLLVKEPDPRYAEQECYLFLTSN